MAKIPFDIKYRPQIESGKYKVVTQDDEPARIICWDSTINKERPIIAIVFDDQIEQYKADGHYDNDYDISNYDLFIVTPEEELTPFEEKLIQFSDERNSMECDNLPENREGEILAEHLHRKAAELLALAEKEIAKRHERDVYIPENTYYEQLKKQWEEGYGKGKAKALITHATELTKNLAKSGLDKDSIPYHLIKFMCNLYTCQSWKVIKIAAELDVTGIKAAAMKDLPRWRTIEEATTKRTDENDCVTTETMLVKGWKNRNDYRIVGPECMVNRKMLCFPVVELSKLPGFKEES